MIAVSREEYEELVEGYMGLCLACEHRQGCVEPDAEHYRCENCHELEVFGAEQLLLLGELEIGDI